MSIENDEEPVEGGEPAIASIKKVSAYQKLKRDLSEGEINSSGALKLMLNDLDRINEDNLKLEKFRDEFYRVDKENAVLKEQNKTETSKELLYTLTTTLGAALLGLCPSIWDLSTKFGIIDLGASIVLLIVGLISKFR